MENVYLILLYRPNDEVRKRIDNKFPSAYKYTDTSYLVQGSPFVLASNIAEHVGLKGNERIEDSSGVVLKLNRGYSGYTCPDLWDWLSNCG